MKDVIFQIVGERDSSNATKQLRQARSESLGDPLNVHERHVSDTPLDATVVRSVQLATLRGLFLSVGGLSGGRSYVL
jgi:hypothetical protein